MTQYAIGAAEIPGLSKLIEEAGEVQQQVGRLLQSRFLKRSVHWDGSDPVQELLKELADLQAAIEFVVFVGMSGVVDTSGFAARKEEKYQLFRKWHEEQAA